MRALHLSPPTGLDARHQWNVNLGVTIVLALVATLVTVWWLLTA